MTSDFDTGVVRSAHLECLVLSMNYVSLPSSGDMSGWGNPNSDYFRFKDLRSALEVYYVCDYYLICIC